MASRDKRASFFLTPERKNEFWGVLFLASSLFLFMALISYHPDDLAFFTSRPSQQVRNLCGIAGALVAGIFRSTIGLSSYLLVVLGFLSAFHRLSHAPLQRSWLKVASVVLLSVCVSSFLSLVWIQTPEARVNRGGVLGLWISDQAIHYFGRLGAYLVLLSVGLLCSLLSTELAVLPLFLKVGRWMGSQLRLFGGRAGTLATQTVGLLKDSLPRVKDSLPRRVVLHRRTQPVAAQTPTEALKEKAPFPKASRAQAVVVEPPARPLTPRPKEQKPVQVPERSRSGSFRLPPLDLLESASVQKIQGKEWAKDNAKVLEETLQDFGIEVKVAEVEVGPVITRYECEPAPGVKVQRITALSDDLALALKAPSIRMIAPIPGKARVGIEVPNPASTLVILREVLESEEFQRSTSKLKLAIGKDTTGHPLLADLGSMPHLLIAGTTGSGKTVCVNALISSILFTLTPDQVRFLMVDPKMVELSVFNGLPHLIVPVVTDPKKVPLALNWVVNEMEIRYRLFARLGVRNIEGYHEKEAKGELPEEEIPESLPYLVVIIDELANLMLVAPAEVERTIARLAHLSRAVGIHMVLATQRPSVDVLTGVIKANFPARLSFQVASRVDSRTVLDTIGAEKLLGKGDLLFMQPGSTKLIRAQGTLVTDPEIERVVEFLKAQREPQYESSILEEEVKETGGARHPLQDPLYKEAVRIVVETGQASVSLLQRRMRLGYGRAARILDQMEEEGIVGPIRGAKPREVFLKEVPSEVETT